MSNTRIYFNLHKRCLSVQNKVNGVWKVVRHAEQIILTDAVFKVSESGRQRVLKEQKKNVHAAVLGNEIKIDEPLEFRATRVFYNPYKYSSFVDEGGAPIHESKLVFARGNKYGYEILAQI